MVHRRSGAFKDQRKVSDTLQLALPLTRRPKSFRLPMNATQRSFLLRQVEALREKSIISCVPRSQLHHTVFHASIFVVPKSNRTFKVISDSQLEFQVFWFLLSLRPCCGLPCGHYPGQATVKSIHTDTDQFSHTTSQSGSPALVIPAVLALGPLGSLPPLHRSAPKGKFEL